MRPNYSISPIGEWRVARGNRHTPSLYKYRRSPACSNYVSTVRGGKSKGVLVTASEDGLTVDLHVVIEAGVNMRSVSENLASSVSFTLSEIAQIDPAQLKIAIHIDGMKSRL
ncbi:Asp23/Gls24 family envelope stress response protein [Collinsella stercoris]|uniref:Asp23/Gls24 family envelope stress response protein n=1 Tax=Collinsella stercoris TaxID=147206 RepID=UPI0026EC2AFD|nr:Asp23/Gls24 family envelope stress response protein [Collinsella stercoris]